MTAISESIFDNGRVIIPMAEVSHIERVKHAEIGPNGAFVITAKTTYNIQADVWANPCYLSESELAEFISAWCIYRNELESAPYEPTSKKSIT